MDWSINPRSASGVRAAFPRGFFYWNQSSCILIYNEGSVGERLKPQHSKCCMLERVSEVRILPPPPSFTFSEIERGCLGASRLGMVFPRENPSIFEGERKRPVGNAEVRTNLFEKIPNPFGIFLYSDIFGLVGLFYKGNHKFEPIIALSPKSMDFFFQILFSENELVLFGGIFRLRQTAV